ncbi:hypothetical protein GCM10019059_19730 [Camelimonas fluminis]|nr:hypothetical protein GCM10019059_19730 [Camelimonas fluminis]
MKRLPAFWHRMHEPVAQLMDQLHCPADQTSLQFGARYGGSSSDPDGNSAHFPHRGAAPTTNLALTGLATLVNAGASPPRARGFMNDIATGPAGWSLTPPPASGGASVLPQFRREVLA